MATGVATVWPGVVGVWLAVAGNSSEPVFGGLLPDISRLESKSTGGNAGLMEI